MRMLYLFLKDVLMFVTAPVWLPLALVCLAVLTAFTEIIGYFERLYERSKK